MNTFMERQVAHFIDRINKEALVGRGGGKVQVDAMAIREIVRSEPETAKLVVKAYLFAAQSNPQLFQMALTVASAYYVEFNDNSLLRDVQNVSQGQPIEIGIMEPEGQAISHQVSMEENPIRLFEIEDDDLEYGNISHLARLFHHLGGNPHESRGLQGHIALSFSKYDNDPRPDFLIPPIREYIRKLDAEFPYFLYYIVPDPKAGQVTIYTMSLLSERNFELIPGKWLYRGTEQDMVQMLAPRIKAIQNFCRSTGDDVRSIADALFASFPASVISGVRSELRW